MPKQRHQDTSCYQSTDPVECGAGQTLAQPTPTSDYECVPCEEGTYNALATGGSCIAYSSIICDAGYRFLEGTTMEDRQCVECNPGSFIAEVDHKIPVCTNWKTCNAGFFFQMGTASTDGNCVACPGGTYLDENTHNIQQCKLRQPCPQGTVLVGGTSTTEGTCETSGTTTEVPITSGHTDPPDISSSSSDSKGSDLTPLWLVLVLLIALMVILLVLWRRRKNKAAKGADEYMNPTFAVNPTSTSTGGVPAQALSNPTYEEMIPEAIQPQDEPRHLTNPTYGTVPPGISHEPLTSFETNQVMQRRLSSETSDNGIAVTSNV
jgi:hypothetical protein